ncbi:putative toxin-antitoxin system toxin component, PIN family [Candidatus Gottesmanbacteria bacterium]|nr:putative toxin-antitoxin system toxin component, PIN family [Candidatus Gottesmanbacteria bacterium]
MVRVVFDTNIYISALHFKSSLPRKLLESVENEELHLIISPQIMAEMRGVLRVKFGYIPNKLNLVEELLTSICIVVDPQKRIRVVIEDADDDKIIECAIEGDADFIVSGDRHLLNIGSYKGVKIVSAREFWESL